MTSHDLSFVIPTYRLRDVGKTIEQYDQHFRKNGHALRLIVFVDSSPANQQKYYELLEQTSTHNELYYVGPREKEQFLAYLHMRLRDKRLDGVLTQMAAGIASLLHVAEIHEQRLSDLEGGAR